MPRTNAIMIEPRARSAVQNLNTFHAITASPDFCTIFFLLNLRIRLCWSNHGDDKWAVVGFSSLLKLRWRLDLFFFFFLVLFGWQRLGNFYCLKIVLCSVGCWRREHPVRTMVPYSIWAAFDNWFSIGL